MLTPGEIWPIIAALAAGVFRSGQVVEKIKNGKYVSKEVCAQIHKQEDERWNHIQKTLEKIWKRLDGKAAGEAEE